MIVDGYFKMYPGIRTYQKWVIQELYTKSRRLTNPFGRSRIFLDRWGQQLFNAAFDFIPQSTVGDVINSRGINYIYFSSNFAPIILVNQVHDSIEFEVPISTGSKRIAEMLLSIKASLETPITWRGREFHIPAELKAGGNLKDADNNNPRGLKVVKLTTVDDVVKQLGVIWRSL